MKKSKSLQPATESLQPVTESLQPVSKSYQPVSCALHSELELAIMHGKQLKVHCSNDNESLVLDIKPYDIITRKGRGEFLLCRDKSGKPLEFRLDSIQKFKMI